MFDQLSAVTYNKIIGLMYSVMDAHSTNWCIYDTLFVIHAMIFIYFCLRLSLSTQIFFVVACITVLIQPSAILQALQFNISRTSHVFIFPHEATREIWHVRCSSQYDIKMLTEIDYSWVESYMSHQTYTNCNNQAMRCPLFYILVFNIFPWHQLFARPCGIYRALLKERVVLKLWIRELSS